MIRPAPERKSPRKKQKRTPVRRAAAPRRSDDEESKSELEVEGRRVPVSNLEKVLYPKAGFTKGDVINYYIRIAPVLLPHLRERPLTLKRYPEGVGGIFFYEKRCPSHRPEWVKTAPVRTKTPDGEIDFCLANDLPTLVWAANLADLELHTSLAREPHLDRPTAMVFDLDPGPPASILQCAEVALALRDALQRVRLKSFPKTSGSKGLQVYVPLNTPVTFDETKAFAKAVAEHLQAQSPGLIVSKMEKRLRRGKVLIDWSQNDRHKTTVCVYSLRAKDRPTVSTPVTWEEVESARRSKDPGALEFETGEVLKRVERSGDLFAPVLTLKQKLSGFNS